MFNLFITLTNIPLLYAILLSYSKKDYITFFILFATVISSITFHLYHELSINWNNINILLSVGVFLRIGYFYLATNKYSLIKCLNDDLIPSIIIGFIFNILSMAINNMYISTFYHCLWHLYIFSIIYVIMEEMYSGKKFNFYLGDLDDQNN